MGPASRENVETDPRFPSGKWTGFFVQKYPPIGRQTMELLLTFANGKMTGTGRDVVGPFSIEGTYRLDDGRCTWDKHYLGRHHVEYCGFNEGKGIWGLWKIAQWDLKGGFHIWPEGLCAPSPDDLVAEADLPVEAPAEAEPVAVPG